MCSYCKVKKETTVHLFYECDVVSDFVHSFERWIYNKTSVLLNFSNIECLFGKIGNSNNTYIENLLMLTLKFYIYKQRCRDEHLFLPNLKAEIYNCYKQECYSYLAKGNITSFDKRWHKFKDLVLE